MPQVSVGNVENLEEALTAVMHARESLVSSCQQLEMKLNQNCEDANREEQASSDLLQQSADIESEATQAVERANEDLHEARETLASANAELNALEVERDGR